MKTKIQMLILAVGLTLAGAGMATPQICPIVSPDKWMTKEQIEALALGLGYDKVFFVQPDGGCWVAYSEKEGVHYEIFFHPATGEVVRTERGS